ncbi:Prefoldin subunit 6 [Batrachochytrium dendrobatidis]|nr:Prefoldin subunit 6 [Batrachochytrium dendrobatidis]
MSLEQQLQAEVTAFQTLQKDYFKAVQNRTQLESQLKENEEVSKEFKFLKDDATIYKLVGPVLVKQDTPEAVGNVSKRIEYISGEIKRVELQIKDLEEKQEKKKLEVVKLQTMAQNIKKLDQVNMPFSVYDTCGFCCSIN